MFKKFFIIIILHMFFYMNSCQKSLDKDYLIYLKSEECKKILEALNYFQKVHDRENLQHIIDFYWICDDTKIKNKALETIFILGATKIADNKNSYFYVYEIGNIDKSIFPILIDAITDTFKILKLNAISHIASIGDKKFEDYILQLLKDTDRNVKIEAIDALYFVGTQKSIGSLIEIIETDTTNLIINTAIRTIENIGNEKTMELIKRNFHNFPYKNRSKINQLIERLSKKNEVIR